MPQSWDLELWEKEMAELSHSTSQEMQLEGNVTSGEVAPSAYLWRVLDVNYQESPNFWLLEE